MQWNTPLSNTPCWSGEISNKAEKEKIGSKLAEQVENKQVIGVGSGSTSFVTLQKIAERVKQEKLDCFFVPSSYEIQMSCKAFGLQTLTLMDAKPDWYFDGADEVDNDKSLIKGRGGAMTREKLVMKSVSKTYILVDQSKFVTNLGKKFPVPVEVIPEALHFVERELISMGAETAMRMAKGKDGPIITESGSFILDAAFQKIEKSFEKDIKSISGVIESGLFVGYDIEIVTN